MVLLLLAPACRVRFFSMSILSAWRGPLKRVHASSYSRAENLVVGYFESSSLGIMKNQTSPPNVAKHPQAVAGIVTINPHAKPAPAI